MISLNKDNYYSLGANRDYMSVSQYKQFLKCPACAMAEISGDYVREETTALLLGNFVDSYFEGTQDVFIRRHPEIMKRDGSLKAEFVKAEEAIKRISEQPIMMECLSGKKQEIMTGVIGGVTFKIKMDSYRPETMIADLKYMRDFEDIYVKEQGRLPWYEAWGYDIQGAVYREVVRQNTGLTLPFVLVAVTKEDVPDVDVVEIPDELLSYELEQVEKNAPEFDAVKKGVLPPSRCEKCDFCKASKVLTEIRVAPVMVGEAE